MEKYVAGDAVSGVMNKKLAVTLLRSSESDADSRCGSRVKLVRARRLLVSGSLFLPPHVPDIVESPRNHRIALNSNKEAYHIRSFEIYASVAFDDRDAMISKSGS